MLLLIKLKEKFNFKESIISVALLLFLYLMQDILRLRNDIYSFLACICIYIILGFIGSNIEKINMLDKIVRWIAKYSYPIFISHNFLLEIFVKYYWTVDTFTKFKNIFCNSGCGAILIYTALPVIVNVIFGILLFYIADRPISKLVKKYL